MTAPTTPDRSTFARFALVAVGVVLVLAVAGFLLLRDGDRDDGSEVGRLQRNCERWAAQNDVRTPPGWCSTMATSVADRTGPGPMWEDMPAMREACLRWSTGDGASDGVPADEWCEAMFTWMRGPMMGQP
jgi:hypothetical protein